MVEGARADMASIAPRSGMFSVVMGSSREPLVRSGTGMRYLKSLYSTVELSMLNSTLSFRRWRRKV